MKRAIFAAAFVSSACGASPSKSASTSTASEPTTSVKAEPGACSALTATLTLAASRVARIQDVRAKITLTSTGTCPRTITTTYLAFGQLSLEVHDPSGARVPPSSPPVPMLPADLDHRALAPAESLVIDDVSPAIAISVAAGRYTIRFAGIPADADGAIVSDWLPFDVAP